MRGVSFEVARVTIEFTSPVRVGAGGWDPLVDAVFATDPNGFPAIPGTTLAGVLRHAAIEAWSTAEAERLFGFQRRDQGEASHVEVSWGQVHGADDRPVPLLGAKADEVTALLGAGQLRDHVRIDPRGVVDGRGKHDELIVPAGARFTFELVVHEGCAKSARDLVALLASPSVRIGAGSRKGLGRFRVVRVRGRAFNLKDAADRAVWARVPRGLDQRDDLPAWPDSALTPAGASKEWSVHRLLLSPKDFWMIGGGDPFADDQEATERPADMVPVTARRVEWKKGPSGTVGVVTAPEPVVPGSALKGALRHRVLFHLRRQKQVFTPPDPGFPWPFGEEDKGTPGDEQDPRNLVVALFGAVKDHDDGAPGRMLITDGVVSGAKSGRLDHVSLDRFTQGPMDHLLFSEAPLFRGTIEVQLALRWRGVSPEALAALRAALADLTEGRLSIGAGASRGHGFCTGRLEPGIPGGA